jgi:23S rRNA pseudouridine955/2504/2580 synthase
LNYPRKTQDQTVRHLDVDAEAAGQRLDNFLLGRLKGVPRSHVYRLIRSGQVRVNSGRVAARYRLRDGDRVRIPPVRQGRDVADAPEPAGLDWLERRIVYEDSRLLVLDKPAGLAVHGGSGVAVGCIEALRSLRPRARTLELVHRLDRATSGCLLVAKRSSTLRELHSIIRDRGMSKRYLALLHGDWQLGRVEIAEPVSTRRHAGDVRSRVDPSGKPALSRFRLLERFAGIASYVEVEIVTGRTHQIRVHAAHAGHPVAGDPRYGDPALDRRLEPFGLKRMFLHAHAVSFDWPGDAGPFAVSAPLPDDLGAVLEALGSA